MTTQDQVTLEAELGMLGAPVFLAGDPGYDDARQVWNTAVDRRPRAVVRCRGGVVLDLGALQDVVVDPGTGTARVGAGVRWGQLADAAAVHGLAPVGGHVTGVGVPGLLLGGGVGWLARRHGLACLTNAPPEPFVPEELHFRPCVLVGVCWTGDPAEGPARVAPLRDAGEPVADLVGELPFAALQHLFDGFNAPTGFHMRAHLLAEPTDDALDTLVDATGDLPPGMSSALLLPLGGAVADVPPSATAFAHRAAAYNLEVAGAWPPGQADTTRERVWAEACWSAMDPFAVGVEVNHLADEGPERVREAYGPDNFARLADLKRAWDPDNVLRLNQNVPPA